MGIEGFIGQAIRERVVAYEEERENKSGKHKRQDTRYIKWLGTLRDTYKTVRDFHVYMAIANDNIVRHNSHLSSPRGQCELGSQAMTCRSGRSRWEESLKGSGNPECLELWWAQA